MRVASRRAICLLLSALSVLGACARAQAEPKEYSLWDLSYRNDYPFTRNPDAIVDQLELQGPRAAEMRAILERQKDGARQYAFSRLEHANTFGFFSHRDESPKAPSAEDACKLLPATEVAERKGKMRTLSVKPAKIGDVNAARASWEAEMPDGMWSGETLCLRRGPRNWQMEFQIHHIKDKKANRARLLAAREEAEAVFNSIRLLDPERSLWNLSYRAPYAFTDNIGELTAMGAVFDKAQEEHLAATIERAKQPRNRMRLAFSRLTHPNTMGGATRFEGDWHKDGIVEKLCRDAVDMRVKSNAGLMSYEAKEAKVSGVPAIRATWRVRMDSGVLFGESLCLRDAEKQTLVQMEYQLRAPENSADVPAWRAEAVAALDSVRLGAASGKLTQYERK